MRRMVVVIIMTLLFACLLAGCTAGVTKVYSVTMDKEEATLSTTGKRAYLTDNGGWEDAGLSLDYEIVYRNASGTVLEDSITTAATAEVVIGGKTVTVAL